MMVPFGFLRAWAAIPKRLAASSDPTLNKLGKRLGLPSTSRPARHQQGTELAERELVRGWGYAGVW